MVKLLMMLKKNEALTTEQFRKHYEDVHARIGAKYLKGRAVRYVRRFLDPIPDRVTGAVPETDYDVITEIWFADEEGFKAALARLSQPDASAEITADERILFERSRHRFYRLTEHESAEVTPDATIEA